MAKLILILAMVLGMFFYSAWAGEREELVKKFEQETIAAEKELSENAKTTVDLVGAAGNCSLVSEKQLFLALDYKLRQTSEASSRLRIIEDFYRVSKEVQKLHLTPREGMGTLAGMFIYHAEAIIMRQQIAVWMLDSETEKLWKRIADATLILNGRKIKLNSGKANFASAMYDEKVILELLLFPKDTFSFGGRDFAIIRTDIHLAVNDDYSTVYLCELKKGNLVVHTKLKHPYVSKWVRQKNKLILYYLQQKVEIAL